MDGYTLTDSEHVLRARLITVDGETITEYASFSVDNLKYAGAGYGAVFNPRKKLTVSILHPSDFVPLQLTARYRARGTTQWLTDGFSSAYFSDQAVVTLAASTIAAAGEFEFELTISYSGLETTERYLFASEPQLALNFPVAVPILQINLPGIGPIGVSPGLAVPTVGDILGDSANEIVLMRAGDPLLIFVYSLAGDLLRTFPVGTTLGGGDFQGALYAPVLADLNGDGKDELVVAARDRYFQWQIFAVRGDGSVMPGWPVTVPQRGTTPLQTPSLLAFKPRLNASPQIVFVSGNGDTITSLDVYSASGQSLWNRVDDGFSCEARSSNSLSAMPVVQDLNGDCKPEIILYSSFLNCQEPIATRRSGRKVTILSSEGLEQRSFSAFVNLTKQGFYSPSSAARYTPLVVDLDGGAPEIILSERFVGNRVFTALGIELLPWRRTNPEGFGTYSAAFPLINSRDPKYVVVRGPADYWVGDQLALFGSSSTREIPLSDFSLGGVTIASLANGKPAVISSNAFSVGAIDAEGQSLSHFPKSIPSSGISVTSGDFDNDGRLELATTGDFAGGEQNDPINSFALFLLSTEQPYVASGQQFPQYRANNFRNGAVPGSVSIKPQDPRSVYATRDCRFTYFQPRSTSPAY